MDAVEIDAQILLLAFADRAELLAALQVMAKALHSPLRPAIGLKHVERFSHFGRVDLSLLALDRGGFKDTEGFENSHWSISQSGIAFALRP